MSAFLAIVGDTWKQSKHQWVMVLVLVLLTAVSLFLVAIVTKTEAPDGTPILATAFAGDRVHRGLEMQWDGLYASALRHQIGYDEELRKGRQKVDEAFREWSAADFDRKRLESQDASFEEIAAATERVRELQRRMEAMEEQNRELDRFVRNEVNRQIELRSGGITPMRKGAEWWLGTIAAWIFSISMIGFIAISAGYIPNMLESGSVDLVLSKPIRRWHIFFGKYVGGLLLFSLALVILYVIIFVFFGIKTGVWLWQWFGALPMTIFSLALLYAIVAWVGLWTRSTGMAMVIGFVYYGVVDTAVGVLTDPANHPFVRDIDWIQGWIEIVKVTFPSFHWLKKSAESAVFSVVVLPWAQIGVGAAWLVIALGTAFNRFRINDY
jgi:ABC-type transport system involved in multi-copper enzyme maturation permease subunit